MLDAGGKGRGGGEKVLDDGLVVFDHFVGGVGGGFLGDLGGLSGVVGVYGD